MPRPPTTMPNRKGSQPDLRESLRAHLASSGEDTSTSVLRPNQQTTLRVVRAAPTRFATGSPCMEA